MTREERWKEFDELRRQRDDAQIANLEAAKEYLAIANLEHYRTQALEEAKKKLDKSAWRLQEAKKAIALF